MSNGTFQIAGVQTGAQSGNTADPLGPYTVQFTATSYEVAIDLTTGTNTITVPTGAGGVVINPPAGSVVTLELTIGFINPGSPTFWNFDPANAPTSFTITAGAPVIVVFRFT